MRERKYGRIAIDPKMHKQVAIAAATEGCSMKALTERLLRLGMVAPELCKAIELADRQMPRQRGNLDYEIAKGSLELAWIAYDTALNPEGDPDD